MKTIAVADDDSLVGLLADTGANLLVSLGDLWDATIEKACALYGCETVFAVRGNHDSAAPFPSPITDLHLEVVEYGGVRFGGFGGSWKYKPRGHHLYEQSEVREALRSFPAVDVFVAHNSPRDIHERDSEVHQGFEAFNEYIDRARPRYFLHGHQHVNEVTERSGTTVIGVYGEAVLELDFSGNHRLQ